MKLKKIFWLLDLLDLSGSILQKLLDKGHEVVGIDNLNDYYSVKLKNKGYQF